MAITNIVSVSSIYAGNAAWALTNTLDATLFTVAADVTVKINSITATNTSATVVTNLTLQIFGLTTSGQTGVTIGSGQTDIMIAAALPVPGSDVLSVIDRPLYLMENDILKGGSSVSGSIDLFICYEVINDA
jgi:hypothetical protein